MDHDEEMSIRISNYLNNTCLNFEKRGDSRTVEWHDCYCKANGSHCTCVWHITNTCEFSRWKGLSFVEEYEKGKIKQSREIISDSIDNSIDNRFEILDL